MITTVEKGLAQMCASLAAPVRISGIHACECCVVDGVGKQRPLCTSLSIRACLMCCAGVSDVGGLDEGTYAYLGYQATGSDLVLSGDDAESPSRQGCGANDGLPVAVEVFATTQDANGECCCFARLSRARGRAQADRGVVL